MSGLNDSVFGIEKLNSKDLTPVFLTPEFFLVFGIILDFNEKDEVVGVEILRVKKRIPLANLRQMQFEVA